MCVCLCVDLVVCRACLLFSPKSPLSHRLTTDERAHIHVACVLFAALARTPPPKAAPASDTLNALPAHAQAALSNVLKSEEGLPPASNLMAALSQNLLESLPTLQVRPRPYDAAPN